MGIVVERDSTGGRIEAARKAAKLTQTELAERIFCDEKKRDLVKHWEIGDRQIKSDHLALLCKALGVSADFIIGLADDHTPDVNIKEICHYTGLSSATITRLHNCPNIYTRNFYRALCEHIVKNSDYGLDDVPVLIYRAAQAHIKGQSKENDSAATGAEKGNDFVIAPDDAEGYFMYRAMEEIKAACQLAIDLIFCKAVDEIKRTGKLELLENEDKLSESTDNMWGNDHGND